MNEDFKMYLLRVLPDVSYRKMALRAELVPSTLGRQIDGDLTVQTVIAICRAYSLPVVDAFRAAHFVTDADANHLDVALSLSRASDRDLVEEMLRRIASGEAGPDITEPVSDDAIANVGPRSDASVIGDLPIDSPEESRQSDFDKAALKDQDPE